MLPEQQRLCSVKKEIGRDGCAALLGSHSELEKHRAMPVTGTRTAVKELIGNVNRVDIGHSWRMRLSQQTQERCRVMAEI